MNETPATVRMIDGATAPVISNVFVNNACAVCTLQITGSFAAATVLVEGIVNVASNQWVTLAAFNLSDLSLEKNGADKAGIYQVGIEGILRVRMNVTEVTGGDITIAAQFGNATINQFSKTEASNLIPITAYDLAVAGGYTGTLEQFETDMGNSGTNAANAAASASAAAASAESVSASAAQIATNTSDISDLKESIAPLGIIPIVLNIKDKYISTSGTALNPNSPTASVNFDCAMIDCSPGDMFTIHGGGLSTNTLPWVFLDSSNNVLTKSTEIVVDEIIIAPANASKLILNNRKASYPDWISYYGENILNKLESVDDVSKIVGLLGKSSFTKESGQTHSQTSDKITGLNISTGDRIAIYFKRSGNSAYTYFYGYDADNLNPSGKSLVDTNVLEGIVFATAPFDIKSIGWADSHTTYSADYWFSVIDYDSLIMQGVVAVDKLKTFYSTYIRNGSWANLANSYTVTSGLFNVDENVKSVTLVTDRPTDSENAYYSIGCVALRRSVGDLTYSADDTIKNTVPDTVGTYRMGDVISIPGGTKSVAFNIAQYDSAQNAWLPLRANYFDGFRIQMLPKYGDSENIDKEINNAKHNKGNVGKALTLLHFSDLHKNQNALSRIMDAYNSINTLVDGVICTGDMVANTAEEISSWWNPAVMTCIGNHDTASYDGSSYDWTALSMADRDAYYIAPFESNWGITHTAGTSYYYKDYTEQNIRLIVMDVMLYMSNNTATEATAQTTWLSNLLSDAITNELHVLIAIHCPHDGAIAEECSFSRYNQTPMQLNIDCNTPQIVIDTVDSAITNGLHFVGYICGHTHQDNIWDAENNGKQLMFCITTASTNTAQWKNSDQYRAELDAYNVITIDTVNSLIKIVRGGGADIDDHMRTRKAICIDYSTGEVVGEVL